MVTRVTGSWMLAGAAPKEPPARMPMLVARWEEEVYAPAALAIPILWVCSPCDREGAAHGEPPVRLAGSLGYSTRANFTTSLNVPASLVNV